MLDRLSEMLKKDPMTPCSQSFIPSPTIESSCCCHPPAFDIYENDQEFLLVADLPGVSPEEISVDLEAGVLSVSTGTSEKNASASRYRRQFKFAAPIDPHRVSAEASAGELTIRLGKSESSHPRRIEVHEA